MRQRLNWGIDAALLAAFVALSVALARGHLVTLDLDVADWADAHQPPVLHWTARVFNYLGQGGQVLMPLAILLAGLLSWRRRSLRPLLVFAAAFVLTYVTIGPLKIWFARAAPHSALADRATMFNSGDPYLLGYPSGHVANTVVWFGVIILLLRGFDRPALSPRSELLLRILPPAIVFVTTTYLAFHWITDSVAGLFLGLLLWRLFARVPWEPLTGPHDVFHMKRRRQDDEVGA